MKTGPQLLSLLACLGSATVALAQGNAFTYQGRLGSDSTAANGYYDLKFELYGTESNPLNTLGTFATNHVAVSNGLFAIRLDLGSVWDGTDRWLQIAVKTNGAPTFTTLAPRQKLTPAPYAIHATRADGVPWSGLSGVPIGAGLSLAGGNTFNVNFAGSGIGTAAARSDHDHFGQTWLGTAAAGLTLRNQNPSGPAMGISGETASPDGVGVSGLHSSSSGTGVGVKGLTASLSSEAAGVLGVVDTTTPELRSAGVRGINRGTNYPGIGVFGSQGGSGFGVYGETPKGIGAVGYSSQGMGVWGLSSGVTTDGFMVNGQPGVGVLGQADATTGPTLGVLGQVYSADGIGVRGEHLAVNGTNAGVSGVTYSTDWWAAGVSGLVATDQAAEYSSGVVGYNQGTNLSGIGVTGKQSGGGFGVYGETPRGVGVFGRVLAYDAVGAAGGTYAAGVVGENFASDPSTLGVFGRHYGSGYGVSGSSAWGIGVQGNNYWGYQASLASTNAAVTASAPDATSAAVRIERGALQVVGAGVGTSTPAFIHVANGTNTSGHVTTLDHPLSNGDAHAILIVTPNWSVNSIYNSHPIGVYYTGAKWAIFNQDFAAMPANAAFNVLVIKP